MRTAFFFVFFGCVVVVALLLMLLQVAHRRPSPHYPDAREGVHRFDATYAAALAHTLHAPLPLPTVLPPASSGGGTTFLGVPPTPPTDATTTTTTVFEHRPFLVAEGGMDNSIKVVADRPMSPRRLPPGSQKRVLVSSPAYLAQFDRADRLRVLKNCARWLHPSQGLLVLRFLDGGGGLQKWIAQCSQHYHCRASIACDGGGEDCGVWHITEEISSSSSSSRYASLLFVDTASVWASQVRRAGLEVMHQEEGGDQDGAVLWICRASAAAV